MAVLNQDKVNLEGNVENARNELTSALQQEQPDIEGITAKRVEEAVSKIKVEFE